uniref:Ycf15 n=1 Tax=Romanomermis culicivorax TaxID=13658 RepID=A0A915IGV1_ROMCU
MFMICPRIHLLFCTCHFRRNQTERNAIDRTQPNEREIFVPFGLIGGYRRSFSAKLQFYVKLSDL